jgi:transposase
VRGGRRPRSPTSSAYTWRRCGGGCAPTGPEGDDALAGAPPPDPKPFPIPEQEAEAVRWLTRKPTAFGFRTDLWTAARVAHLIRERFGVAYHPGYLREWLTRRRHTPQKPARRAE